MAIEQTQNRKTRTLTKQDLPLACPTADMTLWNSHPRVFLPIERTGKAVCPYCSTTFLLVDHAQ